MPKKGQKDKQRCTKHYKTLENTEGAIKNGQSRETGNIDGNKTKKSKAKTQHNMCWTPLYANKHKNVNKQ
jgi:hypothetical protein